MIYYANDEPVVLKRFPNGELDLSGVLSTSHLILRWESDEDLFNLMLIKRHIQSLGQPSVHLTILYMPYSRMDRDERGGSACSLRYAGEFIQSLGFKTISVMDPHSDLTLAYLGMDAKSFYPFISFEEPSFHDIPGLDEPVIMFPDAGAQKRYHKEMLFRRFKQIVGNKVRDFKTGHILDYDISNGAACEGKTVVIVDDLCSKGTTFLFAARALERFKPACVVLLTSHCEKTIFQGELLKPGSPVDFVVTTNSLLNKEDVDAFYHETLKILPPDEALEWDPMRIKYLIRR